MSAAAAERLSLGARDVWRPAGERLRDGRFHVGGGGGGDRRRRRRTVGGGVVGGVDPDADGADWARGRPPRRQRRPTRQRVAGGGRRDAPPPHSPPGGGSGAAAAARGASTPPSPPHHWRRAAPAAAAPSSTWGVPAAAATRRRGGGGGGGGGGATPPTPPRSVGVSRPPTDAAVLAAPRRHAADVWTIVGTFPTTVPQENSSQSGIVLLPPLRTSAQAVLCQSVRCFFGFFCGDTARRARGWPPRPPPPALTHILNTSPPLHTRARRP